MPIFLYLKKKKFKLLYYLFLQDWIKHIYHPHFAIREVQGI